MLALWHRHYKSIDFVGHGKLARETRCRKDGLRKIKHRKFHFADRWQVGKPRFVYIDMASCTCTGAPAVRVYAWHAVLDGGLHDTVATPGNHRAP